MASKNYGGGCLNQSSSSGNSKGCENVLDGDTTVGWESGSNESINSFIQIGFHTTFIINKLRIMPKTSSGQQIQEMWLEFSDCSLETVRIHWFPSINWGQICEIILFSSPFREWWAIGPDKNNSFVKIYKSACLRRQRGQDVGGRQSGG